MFIVMSFEIGLKLSKLGTFYIKSVWINIDYYSQTIVHYYNRKLDV